MAFTPMVPAEKCAVDDEEDDELVTIITDESLINLESANTLKTDNPPLSASIKDVSH